MLLFIIAFLFGVGQILLTEQLVYAVKDKTVKRITLFFALKFVLYGIGVGIAIIKCFWQLDLVLSGFVVALPVAAIMLYVYRTILKK